MFQLFKKVIAVVAAIFVGVAAFAQVTTSGLNGHIKDESGEPVIGAAVIAVHVPSGTRYGGVTNNEGRYDFQGMRAGGPYTVEISCLGYHTVTFTDVTLQLAENTNVSATLKDDNELLSEAIVISQAASKFSAEQTGASTNIGSREISSVPTVNRSLSDVTRLSPYGGNGMSFAGSDGRLGNFTVDGANFNNNFGLSDNLPGGGNPISIDAIEEMQVVISPYDVRQTNFIGGGVNAITKSGTNTFKGSAYVYHKNENMRGDAIEGETINGAREKDRSTTYGFTLGGPIIKNKLFFFVNAEYVMTPSVAVRWRGTDKVDENGNGIADANNYISRTTNADLEKVSKFVKDKYGYNTGSWTNFPANTTSKKVLARLDWNISDKHHLALRYNYTVNDKWVGPNASSMDGGVRASGARTSQYAMSFANSMYSQQNIANTLSLDLNSRFSNSLSNQLLITYSKLDDARGSNSDPFPFVDIQDGSGQNYMALGYELFTWYNGVHNTVWNAKDDLTWYAGKHKVTGGVSFEYQMADNAYLRNGTGYYRYKTLNDFLTGATPEIVCLTYGYDGATNPAARVQFYRPGVYVQDEWSVNDKFKLTYGIRLDGLFFDNGDLRTNNAILKLPYHSGDCVDASGKTLSGDDRINCTGRHIDTGKWPTANVTVSPRLGFSWDVLGDKSLKVRGGTGLFSGRLPLVFFTNMPTNAGTVQYQAQLGPNVKYSSLPDEVKAKYGSMDEILAQFSGDMITTISGLRDKLVDMGFPYTYDPKKGTVPSAISAVDPKFKMPQVWKTSVAVDYAVPTTFPLSVTVEGIYNKTVNAVCISDWSVLPAEGFAKFNGVDNRPIYPSDFRTGTKAFVLENTSKGYGWTGNVTVKSEPVRGLRLMAAYTHTVSKEITGMPGSAAESAFTYVPTTAGPNNITLHNSQYVTPDRVIASATMSDKANNHYSLIYETWRGGANYSYMTTNDMNGDGYAYDAIYIPTDKEVKDNQFRFKTQDDADRFMDYVHNDKYLSKHQGQYAEGYSVYNPWVHRIDFSYKHDFKINCGKHVNTLQLSLDMKNVLNFFNSSWGVSKFLNPNVSSDGIRVLKYEGQDADRYPVFSTPKAINASTETFVRSHTLGQCWYASVGIKYMFN